MATSTEPINKVQRPWFPTDQQIDDKREKALMGKMKMFINKLECSQFYHDFREEVQSWPIFEHIQRVLGSESKMTMVIYGIGSIESNLYDKPKWQLSLAILMKRDFNWIGDIQVFDPILSATEIRVLKFLSCSFLGINEKGRRQVLKPTMFFMPFCGIDLFNNLLEANWGLNQISNTIIFGNSLDLHIKVIRQVREIGKLGSSKDPAMTEKRTKLWIWQNMGHILAAQTFTNEFKMRIIFYDDDARLSRENCEYSFETLSWHFFNPVTETFMQLMREKTGKKHGVLLPRKK